MDGEDRIKISCVVSCCGALVLCTASHFRLMVCNYGLHDEQLRRKPQVFSPNHEKHNEHINTQSPHQFWDWYHQIATYRIVILPSKKLVQQRAPYARMQLCKHFRNVSAHRHGDSSWSSSDNKAVHCSFVLFPVVWRISVVSMVLVQWSYWSSIKGTEIATHSFTLRFLCQEERLKRLSASFGHNRQKME